MFLLLHKDKFCIIFFLFINIEVFGDVYFSHGSYLFPTNISEEQCYENAKKDAIKNVITKAGFSFLSNKENLICTEIKGEEICEYFKEIQVSYDNGYVKSKEFSNKQIINDGLINRKCKIYLRAELEKFDENHDPNYILKASLNHNIFRNGEKIIISGETNINSKIYLFYLNNISEEAILLFPNKFEKKLEFNGKFKLPLNNDYNLIANFPSNHNKDIILENILLLAVKSQKGIFEVIENEPTISILKRLNLLGRDNWKKIQLNYFVSRE